jgi:hypothetical protein
VISIVATDYAHDDEHDDDDDDKQGMLDGLRASNRSVAAIDLVDCDQRFGQFAADHKREHPKVQYVPAFDLQKQF